MKLREKKVNVLGKSIPVIAVIAMVLMAGIAGAALVDYLSNTITTEATVSSPIELKGELLYWSAEGGFLAINGAAEAAWTPEEKYLDNFSAHLKTNGTVGAGDEARIVVIPMPERFTIEDLQTLSWWTKTTAGYPPHVDVMLDINDDGVTDNALVFEYAFNTNEEGVARPEGPPTYGALNDDVWYLTFSDDEEGPTDINDTAYAWLATEASGPFGGELFGDDGHYGATLSDWKGGKDVPDVGNVSASTRIMAFEIEIDNWLINTDTYIDYITINGDTYEYDLEPDSYAFAGVPLSVQLYGGDEFFVHSGAKNLANTPINAVYSCNVSATGITADDLTFESVVGSVWSDPTIVVAGTLTTITVNSATIDPMGTDAICFKVKANPRLAPANYTFDIQVVPPIAPL